MQTDTLTLKVRLFTLVAIVGIAISFSSLFLPFFNNDIESYDPRLGWYFVVLSMAGVLFFIPFGVFTVLPYVTLLAASISLLVKNPRRAAVFVVSGIIFALIGTLIYLALSLIPGSYVRASDLLFGYYAWFAGALLTVVASIRAYRYSCILKLPEDHRVNVTNPKICLNVYKNVVFDASYCSLKSLIFVAPAIIIMAVLTFHILFAIAS